MNDQLNLCPEAPNADDLKEDEERVSRTIIDMETEMSDGSHDFTHVNPAHAYDSLQNSEFISRAWWETKSEEEKQAAAREWCHIIRASRLEVLDMRDVDEGCEESSQMIRVIMALMWEACAGIHEASDILSDVCEYLWEKTPSDRYIFI